MITIRGLVVPSDWDGEGKVAGISVFTFDEDQYRIHMDQQGKQLLVMIRKEVEVRGLFLRENDQKGIKVRSYELIKDR